jgi:hypothetical protein
MLRFREKRDKLVHVAPEITLALERGARIAGWHSSLSASRRTLTIWMRRLLALAIDVEGTEVCDWLAGEGKKRARFAGGK